MPVLGGGGTMPTMLGRQREDSMTTQARKRRYRRVKDNHGRWFGFPSEGPDGHACGPIEFIAFDRTGRKLGNVPGVMPPQAYLKMTTDEDGMVRLRVAYDLWKADIRRCWQDFGSSVRNEYAKVNSACDWTPNGRSLIRGDVREKVGPDPGPIEPVLACEQGNAWALYGIGTCPAKLLPFIDRMQSDTNVLADREKIRFDDGDDEQALAPVVDDLPTGLPTDLPGEVQRFDETPEMDPAYMGDGGAVDDLDDEFEAKGMRGGVEPVRPKEQPKGLGTAYQTHVKEARGRGLTIAEAAKEWRDLKARRTVGP